MAQKHNISDTEYPMTRMGTIQQPSRRYRRLRHPSFTAAVWTANNPLLQRGEFGSEIDTGKLKIGDGVTYWNDLGYVAASEIAFADITGTPDDNVALKNALDAKQDVLTEGTGIDIDSDNVISNTGVRSVATGTTNGTISVNIGGTSAEVAVYGLDSAAYTSSSDYATAAQGTLADNAANKDLSNLTSTGANIGLWCNNAANIITKIPQDIKLELSSGTLTLKAGSKCYLKTDTTTPSVNIASDLTTTQTTNGTYFAIYNGSALTTVLTTTYDYSSLPSTYSLPLAIITVSGGAISSIDRIFNGFGYIGSTVFALPGVKGLIPNGRNADGTLKNNTMTVQTVLTRTIPSNTGWHYLSINANGTSCDFRTNYFQGTSNPSSAPQFSVFYNYDTNFSYLQATLGAWTQQNNFVCPFRIEHESSSPYKIISMQPANVFRTVDYSDTEYMAHQTMPSDKYIDLTLGASGATYTAPADGYLTVNKSASAAGQYINFVNSSNGMNCNSIAPSALPLRLCMPVSKGDVITINYNAAGTTTMFRFIYANGAK